MFRGNGERWTIDQDKQILEMRKQGKSQAYIAKIMGRSTSSITSRLQLLKSKSDPFYASHHRAQWTTEEDEQLLTLRQGGTSWEEIADVVGRPVGGVKHRCVGLKQLEEDG